MERSREVDVERSREVDVERSREVDMERAKHVFPERDGDVPQISKIQNLFFGVNQTPKCLKNNDTHCMFFTITWELSNPHKSILIHGGLNHVPGLLPTGAYEYSALTTRPGRHVYDIKFFSYI